MVDRKKKKRKGLGGGEQLEERIAPSIIGGVTGVDELPDLDGPLPSPDQQEELPVKEESNL